MKKLWLFMLSCIVLIALSTNVSAANIVYSISGDLNVKINGGAEFEGKQVTWNFSATTDNIYHYDGTFETPAMLRIDGITGTVEIEDLLPETQLVGSFDIGSSIEGALLPGVAFSMHGGATPIIWLTNNDLDQYNLETEIGPLICNIFGAPFNGPYELIDGKSFEVASLLSAPISFEANIVAPIPSSLLLLVTGLAGLEGLRRRSRKK